jgi:uncharacterized membrane protein YedE/YeeE
LPPDPVPSTRIILLCIASAVLYGLVHDQFTARICIEYFTVAHPHVIDTASPTLIALYWGAAATWWVGALLGIPLAVACRAGSRSQQEEAEMPFHSQPQLSASQLVRPIGILLLCMAGCALVSGIVGYFLTSRGIVSAGEWASVIPASAQARFFADAYAHVASYASGFLGGIVVIVWAVLRRRQLSLVAGTDARRLDPRK